MGFRSGWISARIALLAACGLLGCSEAEDPTAGPTPRPPVAPPAATGPRDLAVLEVRDHGEIRFELLDEIAPETVESFVELAEQGFYDGTTFHRVIPEFVIQGGDPNTRNRDPRDDGRGGPGFTLVDEFNDVSHLRGIVSMANRGRSGTAGSQFFIVLEPARPLDRKYTVFGQVIDGIEVADTIAGVEVDRFGRWGPRDRPRQDVVIERVRIERGAAGTEAPAATHAGLGEEAAEAVDPTPADG